MTSAYEQKKAASPAARVPLFSGRLYAEASPPLEPFPAQESGVLIWVGSSWSEAGVRRVVRLGEGWLASAYHITEELLAQACPGINEPAVTLSRGPKSHDLLQLTHVFSSIHDDVAYL